MAEITNALNQTLHGQITPLSRGFWRLSNIIPCSVSSHDGQFYAAGYCAENLTIRRYSIMFYINRIERRVISFFTSVTDIDRIITDLPPVNETAQNKLVARQSQLTKPPRSLGKLEDIAIWMAVWQ